MTAAALLLSLAIARAIAVARAKAAFRLGALLLGESRLDRAQTGLVGAFQRFGYHGTSIPIAFFAES